MTGAQRRWICLPALAIFCLLGCPPEKDSPSTSTTVAASDTGPCNLDCVACPTVGKYTCNPCTGGTWVCVREGASSCGVEGTGNATVVVWAGGGRPCRCIDDNGDFIHNDYCDETTE